jgi:hypothetical protein
MKLATIQLIAKKRSRKPVPVQVEKKDREVRQPWAGGKYNPATQFLDYEVSNELNDAFGDRDWIDVTTYDADELELIVNYGFEWNGRFWKSFFSFWRDNKGKAILVPDDSPFTNISQIGCFTHMENLDGAMKAGKYINRHFAPLQMGEKYHKMKLVEAGVTDELGNFEGVYETPLGDWIVVKFNNLKGMTPEQVASCDGHLDCSPRFVEVMAKLGCTIKHGQSWTIPNDVGMGKGHSRIIPGLEPDLVIHGPKYVYTIDGLKFGIRTDLHNGQPHLDIFAWFNFQIDRDYMGPKLVRDYLKYVFEAAHNEIAFKKAFLGNINVGPSVYANKEELIAAAYDQSEAWALRRYLQRGASTFAMPWMYRKIVQHLMTKVVQARAGRVPMEYAPGKGVAISRYVAGDIYAVMPDGSINMDNSVIPEGYCVCMDLPEGIEVAIYRQPNEHQNAHVILTNMHHPAYEFAKGGVYIYMGHGQHLVAPRLGGMDNDDALIIVYDPEWVRGFKELALNPYPEYGPLVTDQDRMVMEQEAFFAGEDEDEGRGGFYDELMGLSPMEGSDVAQYSERHTIHQIERARTSGAGIGPVANAVLLDVGVSIPRYKSFIAHWLRDNGMLDQLDQLANKADFQMRKFATHLELIIDGNVKDRALLEGLGDVNKQIQDFHTNARFYPTCLAGKIPPKKESKGDYILVDTPVCRVLEWIAEDIDALMDAFKTNEWLLVRPADREVLMSYPSTKEIRQIVHGEPRRPGVELEELEPGIMTIWKREWATAFGRGVIKEDYERISKIVVEFAKPFEPEMKEIAVEIYRSYYKSKKAQASKDAQGKRRGYSDGILGINFFANHFLDALEDIGFTGETYAVDFDRYRSFMSRIAMNVKVNNGIVYRAKDMRIVGNCKRCPNGEFKMISGLIEVKEAHECLQAPESRHDLPMDIQTANDMS